MNIYRHHINHNQVGQVAKQGQKSRIGSAILSALTAARQYLLNYLTHGNDLQVWQTTDHSGITWWHVRDPQTGTTTKMLTEAEVLTWIEERYSRKEDRYSSSHSSIYDLR